MSRIGKKPIIIPEDVKVEIKDRMVVIKGPKGELVQEVPEEILVTFKENQLVVSPKRELKNMSALWGLTRALLQNCIKGVVEVFKKKLEFIDIGYKASMQGDKVIELEVGYSHPVKIELPQGISVAVEKNTITVSGIDKQKVGEFAAKIRAIRPPEPYKGKGIRYVGEKVRRKEGKKVVGTTGK